MSKLSKFTAVALFLATLPAGAQFKDLQITGAARVKSGATLKADAGGQLEADSAKAGSALATSIAAKADDAATTGALAGKQPLDADLTSIAALATTTIGRSLLTSTNDADARSKINAPSLTGGQTFSGPQNFVSGVVSFNDEVDFDGMVSFGGSVTGLTANFSGLSTGAINASGDVAINGILSINGSDLTLGGVDLTTAGSGSLTLTTTGATNVTLPTSGTLLSTTSMATDADAISGDRSDAVVSPQALRAGAPQRASLKALRNKLAQIKAGENAWANIMQIGDSVAADVTLGSLTDFYRVYGTGGQDGGGAQTGVVVTLAGGSAAAGPDYTKWMTGGFVAVPSGGTITWSATSPLVPTQTAPVMTQLKVYYVRESGAGTFKVQTSTDGSTWTDASGFTSIDASNGSTAFGVATVPVAGNRFGRVVGLTGTVNVIATGWRTAAGAVFSFIQNSGGLVLANMASTPAAMWQGWLAEFRPDLIFILYKDDTDSAMSTAMQTIQGYISATIPTATTVYVGPYNSRIDDPGYTPTTPTNQLMATERAAIRAWLASGTCKALAGDKFYWPSDTYVGTWSEGIQNGLYDSSYPAPAISSITASGTTVTVTTASDYAYNSSSGKVRVWGVSPPEFNGTFPATGHTSTTATYTLPTAPSASTGTGGYASGVDVTHLSALGRLMLAAHFQKDFALLTGADVPTGFLGGTVTGATRFSDTTDASGSTEAAGAAALRTAGGIYAAKKIKTDDSTDATNVAGSIVTAGGIYAAKGIKSATGLGIGTDPQAGLMLNASASSTTGGTGAQLRVTLNPSASTSATAKAMLATTILQPSGTANLTGTQYAGYSSTQISGSGTGAITAAFGHYAEVDHQGAQALTFGYGLYDRLSFSGSGNVGTAANFYADYNKSGAGVVTTAYGLYVGSGLSTFATTPYAVYNASTAPIFSNGPAIVTYVKTTPVTVSALPSAATTGAGARAYVTDATSPTWGVAVTGGGSSKTSVTSDGSSWIVQ